ncbi:TIGR03905 family TSCPD domain-containing protein [[Eubacterium] hominis]|uniref:TIGR03905 family TSCPD domain-containing protein n=1 Tax=[Eubacterium] hominis TaxID=2764325 RepID=UPI003A4E30ED
METFVYRPKGVCSQEMRFEMENDTIKSATIVGGCAGNLLGISKIIKDKKISEVISAFEGVRCGSKPTSCPDQISQALRAYATSHDIKVD